MLKRLLGFGAKKTGTLPGHSHTVAQVVTHPAAQHTPGTPRNVKPTGHGGNRPVARTRQTPRIFNELSDIPPFEEILTGPDGKFALTVSLSDSLMVLQTSKTAALLLASEGTFNKQDYASLLVRVEKEYPLVEVGLTKPSVLVSLYSKVSTRNQRERADSDTAPSMKLFQHIMTKAAEMSASDVHVVIRDDHRSDSAAILFRIDGILRRVDTLPAKDAYSAVAVAYTKLAEDSSRSDSAFNLQSHPSCSVPMVLAGKHYKLRYQGVVANGGLDVVLRLLQTASGDDQQAKSLEELGYSPTQCKQLDLAARKTVGAIVVSGVTGSGKSTTLKTLMTIAPNRKFRKAFSIEDPVEYKIFGVTQISVQRNANEMDSSGFIAAMRVVLRADPDTVMVGEVRDKETCSLLKTMVQSGHQVMTTVHAASAIDIVQRMTSEELGLPRETIGARNFLSALVYQRLVPTLCPECKIPLLKATKEIADPDTVAILRKRFGLHPETMFVANPNGCPHCAGLGSKGVTVIAEIIPPDSKLLRLLREGKDVEAEEYFRQTRIAGFDDPDTTGKTALEHGLYKVHLGLVDPFVLQDAIEPFETYEIVPVVLNSVRASAA